jgi:hypothetical protein
MHVTVTITKETPLGELRGLIASIREHSAVADITIQEAPSDIEYPYSLPMVTIEENVGVTRQFGKAAVEYLRIIANPQHVH